MTTTTKQTTSIDLLDPAVAAVVRDWQELPDPFAMLRDPVPLAIALTAAYPLIDFPAVSRQIVAWWVANPSKRKTRRGVARFVQSWFSREAQRVATASSLEPKGNRDERKAADEHARASATWGDE